jgi:hypothetical protein
MDGMYGWYFCAETTRRHISGKVKHYTVDYKEGVLYYAKTSIRDNEKTVFQHGSRS